MNVISLLFSLMTIVSLVGATAHPQLYYATVNIHYPTSMLCSHCFLNFATSLDWNGYFPDNNLPITYNATYVSPNLYRNTFTYGGNNIGNTYIATVYYSAWGANAADHQWLNLNCRNVLNNLSGANKGRGITLTLGESNSTFDIYPNFCFNEGKVFNYSTFSTQLNVTKTINYYVPGSLLENPLPRKVNYLLQHDSYGLKDSMKTTYDFLISQGIIPELIVYGPSQGIDTDPWIDGGLERTYELTPWPCFVFPGWPPGCAPRTGGAFLYLAFSLQQLAHIQSILGLPSVDREYMATAGFSYGGALACDFTYINNSIFSKGYCGSPAFWYNNNEFASYVTSHTPAFPIKLYIDVGLHESPFITTFIPGALHALLNRPEFVLNENIWFENYTSYDSHQWNSWYSHTPAALSTLYNDGKKLTRNIELYAEAIRPNAFGQVLINLDHHSE